MLYQLDFLDVNEWYENDIIAVGFFTSPEKAKAYAKEYVKARPLVEHECNAYIHSVHVDPAFGDKRGYPEYEWFSDGACCEYQPRMW